MHLLAQILYKVRFHLVPLVAVCLHIIKKPPISVCLLPSRCGTRGLYKCHVELMPLIFSMCTNTAILCGCVINILTLSEIQASVSYCNVLQFLIEGY
jgi:hypothetical protein